MTKLYNAGALMLKMPVIQYNHLDLY